MHFRVTPSRVRSATVTVPGDKSISHRALMLGSIAAGRTEVSGFLAGEDCLATLAAMRALGVDIRQASATEMSIDGVGLQGLRAATTDLDLGNSGTAMRLMAGLLVGQPFDSVLIGDESLTSRPMGRIIKPLTGMGSVIESRDDKPPLIIRGQKELQAIDYVMPMASAQVKSAVLLAGLYADGITSVTEPAVTRDHTERMLRSMGVTVHSNKGVITVAGGQQLHGCNVEVPADLSSASFVLLAALLAENADILIRNVGINPTRTGVIDILRAMGADIGLENTRRLGDEPVADIRVRSSELHGGKVDPSLVSLAIDEFPVLFIAAAAARGETIVSGAEELRKKETDRIAVMARALEAVGVSVEERPDGIRIVGGGVRGGTIDSHGDHRIAMSFAVASLLADSPIDILSTAEVATSFPNFLEVARTAGLDVVAS